MIRQALLILFVLGMPTIDPEQFDLTSVAVVSCPDGPLFRETFNRRGTMPGRVEIVRFISGEKKPLLWLFFADDSEEGPVKIILVQDDTLLELSVGTLLREFPSPCALIATTRRRL